MLRTIGKQLPADLAADASSCSRHQNAFPTDHLPDRLLVDADQGTPKKVCIVKISQVQLFLALLHLKEGRNDLDVTTCFLGCINCQKHSLLVNLGNGNDQCLGLQVLKHLWQILHTPVDLHPEHVCTVEMHFIIDKSYNMVGEFSLLVLSYQSISQLPCPIDDSSRMLVVALLVFKHQHRPVKNTKAHHHEESENIGTDDEWDPITLEPKVKTNKKNTKDGYWNKRG